MKHIKKYKVFELRDSKRYNDITILKRYDIKNYTINEDGSVDIDGDVNLYDKGLIVIPVKFRNVGGDFDCSNNQLTSLEGCPESVGVNFYCDNNKLASLEGCPREVGGDFNCAVNRIVKLDFIPDYVGGDFNIRNNPLDPRWIGSSNWDILELDVVQGKIYK